jgi:NAD-dependent deacetylase
MDYPKKIDRFAATIAASRSLLVITGAGMSADSGLPTYRGLAGLYEHTATEDGIAIETALSGSMFRRRPEITWKYLSQIEQKTRNARFNEGHRLLYKLEQKISRLVILTQNIDGFHSDAGSTRVIEIHGTLRKLVCTGCGDSSVVNDFGGLTIPPVCNKCESIVRPAVVLFEELLPTEAVSRLERELSQPFDCVVSIGTSSCFPYIAQPVIDARRRGASTVEINPDTTPISGWVDIKFAHPATDVLRSVCQRIGVCVD